MTQFVNPVVLVGVRRRQDQRLAGYVQSAIGDPHADPERAGHRRVVGLKIVCRPRQDAADEHGLIWRHKLGVSTV